jgi:hypothetical protein
LDERISTDQGNWLAKRTIYKPPQLERARGIKARGKGRADWHTTTPWRVGLLLPQNSFSNVQMHSVTFRRK